MYGLLLSSTDSDHPRILLHKPRIRALCNNPTIAQANLRSEDLLRKPRIRGFCCANLGSARNHTRIAQPNLSHPRQRSHDRSRKQSSSAIRVNKPRSIAHVLRLCRQRYHNHQSCKRCGQFHKGSCTRITRN